MAGVADRAFREICKEFGAAYLVGEMASAKGLGFGSRKTAQLLGISPAERPMAVQLFGDDPDTMAQAARLAMDYEPDAIDINMGCPAPKIAGNGAGSSLMRSPLLAGRIIKAVVSAVTVPVTVKMRKGWDDREGNAVELAGIAEENGAAAVTVHGRTRRQMYAPPVDLDIIAAVKKAVSIPVIGNGGIDSPEAAKEMYDRTGCDLVMVGQGALGSPWLFARIARYLEDGTLPPDPALEEKLAVMLRHIRLACEYKGEFPAMREARKHVAWYVKGLRGASAFRRRAGELAVFDDLRRLADEILSANQSGEYPP